eukprot:TRINITY_DN1725_c0_g1_i1.p1 TRINITY_DN1725_c0_g1~~TRINITY_DN1725_c0_g1_i1.p1  ORF type:complete len:258 (+),score=16.70 TRINITY_DN1725_c0_g1_i1:241-1014(+)
MPATMSTLPSVTTPEPCAEPQKSTKTHSAMANMLVEAPQKTNTVQDHPRHDASSCFASRRSSSAKKASFGTVSTIAQIVDDPVSEKASQRKLLPKPHTMREEMEKDKVFASKEKPSIVELRSPRTSPRKNWEIGQNGPTYVRTKPLEEPRNWHVALAAARNQPKTPNRQTKKARGWPSPWRRAGKAPPQRKRRETPFQQRLPCRHALPKGRPRPDPQRQCQPTKPIRPQRGIQRKPLQGRTTRSAKKEPLQHQSTRG